MTYTPYSLQTVFENKGNLSLLSDNSQQIYTKLNGEKIFFKLPDGISFTKVLYKDVPWDFHSAEKEGDYIKVIAKERKTIEEDRLHITGCCVGAGVDSEIPTDTNFFEVYTFDLQGNFIAAEVPPSGRNGFDTSIAEDASRMAELGVTSVYTELEIWGIQNADLITENEIRKRGDIRLEEWAYHKYKELNPGLPMLKGLGVENAERLDQNDTIKANQRNLYAPAEFNKKSADKITNFNTSTDALEIDTDSFGIDSSVTFAAGKNKKAVKKLAKQDFDFLYDQKKGGLYFNENGADKGFGEGGIIAILKGAPNLTSDNLEFI